MRPLRSFAPALVAAVVVSAGGTTVALVGASPAISAPAASSSSTGAPVADLLAGSYRSDFGRLSVGGKSRIANRQAVEVTGKARPGRTLTATDGTWKPAKVTLSYRWYADGKKIGGARSASYSPDASVVGEVVTVEVTASKKGYRPATSTGSAGMVKGGTLTSTSAPQIRGLAKVGNKLSVTSGRWSAPDVELTYEWSAGRSVVSTGKRYKVGTEARGKTLRVLVTASKPGYRDGSVSTSRSSKVKG